MAARVEVRAFGSGHYCSSIRFLIHPLQVAAKNAELESLQKELSRRPGGSSLLASDETSTSSASSTINDGK